MTFTILFDLDDTLLGNPIAQFMDAYLNLLGNHLANHILPETMIPQLLRSTDLMIKKVKPCSTLQTVFDEDFYPSLNLSKETLSPLIDEFYADIFPSLQELTGKIPGAQELMDFAFSMGANVVIATNPLFPGAAIEERLKWAGLPTNQYSYELVTSYENLHFAKPNCAFYAEILGLLGWPEGAICMIGNSAHEDIVPASKMNLRTFFVNEHTVSPVNQITDHTSGKLSDISNWLSAIHDKPPLSMPLGQEANLAILAATPAVLSSLTQLLSENEWLDRPIKDEWSIFEIVCHLRDVENEINQTRLSQFLNESNPFITGIDTDIWTEERKYNSNFTPQSLIDFCSSRSRMLDVLRDLPNGIWKKGARHSIFGPTDLDEIISFIATHDKNHIHQVYATLSSLAQ